MKREDLGGVFLAIPSRSRPENVAKMQALVGPATWIVPSVQLGMYQDSGAEQVMPMDTDGLQAARNAALDRAFDKNLVCLQVDDDLKRVIRFKSKNGKEVASFPEAINEMLLGFQASPFRLAGAAPTGNAFFFNPEQPVKIKAFIWGAVMLIKPNDLRFDPRIKTKDDYDYTCAHVQKHGGVFRADSFYFEFSYKTNKGGVQEYRTEALQRRDIFLLQNKWGKWIKLNKTRKNEVLLKF